MSEAAAAEEIVCQFVRDIRKKDRGIGGKKLWYMLCKEPNISFSIGRDRFYDILAANDLKIRRKHRRPKTTDSTHELRVYPNLVKSRIADGPNQIWVSDITYITLYDRSDPDKYKFCYLSLILDSYSEEIVGWSIGPSLDRTYPLDALNMALDRIGEGHVGLIHHSDRGVQYASYDYVRLLQKRNIMVSMTETGNPKDNPQAERINNTIKNELLKGCVFNDIEEVRDALTTAIAFYNNERPHMSIGMLTPVQAATRTGKLDKKWHSYRDAAIENLVSL